MPTMPSISPGIDSINNHYLVKQEQRNNRLAVHRLSAEILSYIMLIGVESDRRTWCWGSRKVGSQQIASHVCRYWRIIATNTPLLWSFVHIASIVPTHHDVLYLIRTGSNTLLDIAIDLSSAFDHLSLENNVKLILLSGMMRALTSQGAQTNRWQSLLVSINPDDSATLSDLLEWLTQNPVPRLQRLYIDLSTKGNSSRFRQSDAAIANSGDMISENARSYLTSLSSNLLCYELVLPGADTFGLTRDMFTKLKELTIISHKITSNELSNLLLSNQQLECLCLGNVDDRISANRFHHHINQPDTDVIRRTVAPSLHSLFIGTDDDINWALRMLIAIEATRLQVFSLKCDTCNSEDVQSVVTYICTGVRPAYAEGPSEHPIFPSLQSLDLSRFTCERDQFITLVSSFPEIPHIALKGKQLQWLNEAPSMFPQLESLGVLGIPAYADNVKKFLARQEAAGHPIEEVEARGVCHGCLRRISTRQRPPSLMLHSPLAPPGYEYSKYEYDIIGDLQSLRRRSTSRWRATTQF